MYIFILLVSLHKLLGTVCINEDFYSHALISYVKLKRNTNLALIVIPIHNNHILYNDTGVRPSHLHPGKQNDVQGRVPC